MKRELLHIAMLFLVAACAYGGGGGGGSSPSNGTTFDRKNPGYVGPSESDEQKCPGITFATNFTAACANFLGQNSDELDDTCAQSLHGVYNTQCSGLTNRIRAALSACGSDFQTYYSYLPQDCQTVLKSVMR